MVNKVSLTQFIIEQQRGLPEASGTFTLLLNDIVTACKLDRTSGGYGIRRNR
jgi:fructose-1,6-bisphosphatase I